MNTPQTIGSGAGMLKDNYDSGGQSALASALSRRRNKLYDKKGMGNENDEGAEDGKVVDLLNNKGL